MEGLSLIHISSRWAVDSKPFTRALAGLPAAPMGGRPVPNHACNKAENVVCRTRSTPRSGSTGAMYCKNNGLGARISVLSARRRS